MFVDLTDSEFEYGTSEKEEESQDRFDRYSMWLLFNLHVHTHELFYLILFLLSW